MSNNKRSSKRGRSRRASKGWPMWGIVTLGVGCFLIVVLGSALGFLILAKRATEQAKTTPSTVLLNPTVNTDRNQGSSPLITPGGQDPQTQPPAFRPDPPADFRIEQPPPQFKFSPPPQIKDNSALVEKQESEQKKPPKSIDESGYTLLDKEEKFAPKNDSFSVMLPAAEKVHISFKMINVGLTRCPVENGSSKTGKNVKSAASIIHGGTVLIKLSPTELSDLVAEAIYKNNDGKLKGKKAIVQDGVEGREYLIENSDGAMRLQMYVIAGIMIMAAVEDESMDKVRSDDADKFLTSIKFTDSLKKLFKDSRRK